MAEENSLEIFHDVIEASIEFLYDEYKKKYFDLFFLTVDNILAGEVLNDLSDDKKAKLEKKRLEDEHDLEKQRLQDKLELEKKN